MDDDLRDLLYSLQHNGIADPRVLEAIASTPRELFITERGLKAYAYADEALPIECEQTISQPFIVAYMTERLNIAPHHHVLEIGTGSGYQAAILSRLARHVYTIECHLALFRLAAERFERLSLGNITAIHRDGTKGWPNGRVFDRILVTAGAERAPQALLDQFAPCGAMIMPMGPRLDQRLTLITKSRGREDYQSLLPVRFVALVPQVR